MLVPGPSAGRWDLWRRFAQLAWVLFLLVGVALVATRVIPALAVGIPIGILVVTAVIASIVLARRAARTMKLERAAGYSTVIDAAGFDLRDANTLALLRSRDVSPSDESRRSLALGIFGVKPGTALAKRLDDEG